MKQELAEAHKLLEKIRSKAERTFQCLVYYAMGRVYLKENRYCTSRFGVMSPPSPVLNHSTYALSDRFAVALARFSDSLQMVKNQITPGKLTWPLTKEIVKETLLNYFKVSLCLDLANGFFTSAL